MQQREKREALEKRVDVLETILNVNVPPAVWLKTKKAKKKKKKENKDADTPD